jgi:lysozyme
MNQYAYDLITKFEGCQLQAYQDQGGVWTIGYGHTGPEVVEGLIWTQDQADTALGSDLMKAENAVRALVHTAVTLQAIGAMVSLSFNIGSANFHASEVLSNTNTAQWLAAARAFLNWDHVSGVENRGLLRRRLSEAALYLS